MDVNRLLSTLSAVCPIDGVGAITSTDLAAGNVRIDYAPGASAPQIAAADAALAAFDWSPAADAAFAQQQATKVIGSTLGARLGADLLTTSASFVDVPALSFLLAPNTHYRFRFLGAYTTAAAATGIQLSVNGPASPAFVRFLGQIMTSAAVPLAGAGGAYDVAIAATAGPGATAMPFWVEGTISTGAAGGAFTLRVRSETAGQAVTVLRGSIAECAAVA